MAGKNGKWGGARAGAGRPVGTGTGRSADARIHRVSIMLALDDLKLLQRVARKRKLPVGTAAAYIVQRSVRAGAR